MTIQNNEAIVDQKDPHTEAATENAVEKGVLEHDTLKYHLLGPSLTKAGQDKVE